MVRAEVKRDGGKITAFRVEGHSGYAEAGSDIVCAGVSSVVWSTTYGLTEYAALPAECEARDGYVACSLQPLSDEQRKQADLLLESMAAYLASLAEQYPDFLRITEV